MLTVKHPSQAVFTKVKVAFLFIPLIDLFLAAPCHCALVLADVCLATLAACLKYLGAIAAPVPICSIIFSVYIGQHVLVDRLDDMLYI